MDQLGTATFDIFDIVGLKSRDGHLYGSVGLRMGTATFGPFRIKLKRISTSFVGVRIGDTTS
jgi:hypothetical protein